MNIKHVAIIVIVICIILLLVFISRALMRKITGGGNLLNIDEELKLYKDNSIHIPLGYLNRLYSKFDDAEHKDALSFIRDNLNTANDDEITLKDILRTLKQFKSSERDSPAVNTLRTLAFNVIIDNIRDALNNEMPNKNYSLVKLYRQIYETLKGSDEQLDSLSDNDKMYFQVIMLYCRYLKKTYKLQSEFTTYSLEDEPIVRYRMFAELNFNEDEFIDEMRKRILGNQVDEVLRNYMDKEKEDMKLEDYDKMLKIQSCVVKYGDEIIHQASYMVLIFILKKIGYTGMQTKHLKDIKPRFLLKAISDNKIKPIHLKYKGEDKELDEEIDNEQPVKIITAEDDYGYEGSNVYLYFKIDDSSYYLRVKFLGKHQLDAKLKEQGAENQTLYHERIFVKHDENTNALEFTELTENIANQGNSKDRSYIT